MRRSVAFPLSPWWLAAALLLIAGAGALLLRGSALRLAESWLRTGDLKALQLTEKVRASADLDRQRLWQEALGHISDQTAAMQVSLWRLSGLGNQIAKRIGLPDKAIVSVAPVPLSGAANFAADISEEFARIASELARIEMQIASEHARFARLGEASAATAMRAETFSHILPVDGKHWLSSGMGYRKDPFTGRRAYHSGYDYSAQQNTPVLAVADGIVDYAGRLGNYGKTVDIYHGDGITTRYGHLHDYRTAKGQLVRGGTVIGLVGMTGRSSGPHLHYEMRHNNRPKTYRQIEKISAQRAAPAK